jgi:hypothetical protein
MSEQILLNIAIYFFAIMFLTEVWAAEVTGRNFVIVPSNPFEHPPIHFQNRHLKSGVNRMQGNFSENPY